MDLARSGMALRCLSGLFYCKALISPSAASCPAYRASLTETWPSLENLVAAAKAVRAKLDK